MNKAEPEEWKSTMEHEEWLTTEEPENGKPEVEMPGPEVWASYAEVHGVRGHRLGSVFVSGETKGTLNSRVKLHEQKPKHTWLFIYLFIVIFLETSIII